MSATLGHFCRISMKQMRAKAQWEKHWNPMNKRSRKYFTDLNKINARCHKIKLSADDVDEIHKAIKKVSQTS